MATENFCFENPKKVVVLKFGTQRVITSDDHYQIKSLGVRVNRVVARPYNENLSSVKLEIWDPLFPKKWNDSQRSTFYRNADLVVVVINSCVGGNYSLIKKKKELEKEAVFYVGKGNVIHITSVSIASQDCLHTRNKFSIQRQIEIKMLCRYALFPDLEEGHVCER